MKLVAVDMDGTFLKSDKTYNRERFHDLYKKMVAKGIQFVVASGNQYYQLKSFFKDYPDVMYAAENGGLIAHSNEIIKVYTFAPDSVQAIEKSLLKQKNINFLVAGVKSAYMLKKFGKDYYDRSLVYYHRLEEVDSLDEIDYDVIKFSIECPPEDTQKYIDLFQENLSEYCDVTSSGHGDIDLIQHGIHKANGLKEVGKLLNIDLNDMTAFGDGNNDLEMIKEVGDGVAMKNASPEMLAACDHVTLTNDEEGVLEYLAQKL